MQDKIETRKILFNKYNTMILSRKQVAEILNVSTATLDRWRKQGLYLESKKVGITKNAIIQYPLSTVVDYISSQNTKIN